MIGGALLAFVTAACVVSLWAALLENLAPASVRRAVTTKPDSCLARARFFPV